MSAASRAARFRRRGYPAADRPSACRTDRPRRALAREVSVRAPKFAWPSAKSLTCEPARGPTAPCPRPTPRSARRRQHAATATSDRCRRAHLAARSTASAAGPASACPQETVQVVGQRLGRRVSLVARLGHRAEHDRLQIDRHRRVDPPRRNRFVVRRSAAAGSAGRRPNAPAAASTARTA